MDDGPTSSYSYRTGVHGDVIFASKPLQFTITSPMHGQSGFSDIFGSIRGIYLGKLQQFTNLNSSAIWGWFPLLAMIPVRENSEVVIIYPEIYIYIYLKSSQYCYSLSLRLSSSTWSERPLGKAPLSDRFRWFPLGTMGTCSWNLHRHKKKTQISNGDTESWDVLSRCWIFFGACQCFSSIITKQDAKT